MKVSLWLLALVLASIVIPIWALVLNPVGLILMGVLIIVVLMSHGWGRQTGQN